MNQSPTIDFHDFHLQELPRRLAAGNGHLAANAARELEAIGFRIQGSDNAYSYQPASQSINIIAGTEANCMIELGQQAWEELVQELESSSGLLAALVSDEAQLEIELSRWELVLRLMFYGHQ